MASRPQRFEMALQLCFFVADTCHTLPLLLFLGMAAKKLSSIFVKHSQLQPSCSPAAICSSIHSFECLHHHLLPGCASVCVPQCVSVWQDCAGWCCLAALQFAIKVNLQLQQGACSSCNLIHRLDSARYHYHLHSRPKRRFPRCCSHPLTGVPGQHTLSTRACVRF